MRIIALGILAAAAALTYPLDGGARTGIRRLDAYRKLVKLPPGAGLATAEIKLRLAGLSDSFDITAATPRDAALQAGLEKIFAGRDTSYNIALLDITNPAKPRYAALRADEKYIPGSVGKLLVATGIFTQLARIHPNDTTARERLLRESIVTADGFVYRDGKTVPFFSPGDTKILNRRLESGDKFNLYEWLDHMLSQSSNAAASTCWKQAILLSHFGPKYPSLAAEEKAFFDNTSKTALRDLALESIEAGLRGSNLDTGKLRIGTMFTSGGSRVVPGAGSYATPNELLRWLVRMEQGKLIDAWSSLEIKRLLYFSRPRYRYASSPALNSAAVYFKSGSLFQCEPEPGYKCVQYKGNKTNLMHSVIVVESGKKIYLVALMSNVLRLNSAVEHQTIATYIERMIQSLPD